jgi:hypothetical protein
MSHATVWLDHREARIFRLSSPDVDKSTVRPMLHPERWHSRGESAPTAHPDDDRRFFADLSNALSGYAHILVIGPSSAKTQFVSYAHDCNRGLEQRIDGVETVDHPTDRQVVALGKKYFKLQDD